MKKIVILIFLYFISSPFTFSLEKLITSPNKDISIKLCQVPKSEFGIWHLKVDYNENNHSKSIIPSVELGLCRNDADFHRLKLLKTAENTNLKVSYTASHGKKSICMNSANEMVAYFENEDKKIINIRIRAYNDGIAFRYEFSNKNKEEYIIKDEYTLYNIDNNAIKMLEPWNTPNEKLYQTIEANNQKQGEWCYPALINNNGVWALIHESDVDENYCGTKLSNLKDADNYKLTFPNPKDAKGMMGDSEPHISLPWHSPWRVVIAGTLKDIVESTLIDDVASPSVIKDTDWIKSGIASWNYWSSNHGTKDYKTVCKFADLAQNMGWKYTLLDWEWDEMGNGGDLNDAIEYIKKKNISPLMWYNSGGNHTNVKSTPKDRMLTHENRVNEFKKLNKLGVKGVKIDFFECEKQQMIKYYLDILKDAADFKIMVYFHGCLVPRGWTRTYPHLMTYEAVRGAEWYNNGLAFTQTAPSHNAMLPFTRNVVGPMDYTPVTFTNSQYPHATSFAHELALSVVFESGIQHFADRPEGYYNLPQSVRNFLMNVPSSWDDIKYINGYPGESITLARRKGKKWFIGGINGQYAKTKHAEFKLPFLDKEKQYKMISIKDGSYDSQFNIEEKIIDSNSLIKVDMLRRGGFVLELSEIQ